MALPAQLLENIPSHLKKAGLIRLASTPHHEFSPLSEHKVEETSPLSRLLQGDFPVGEISELCAVGGSAFTTSIALRACQRVQQQSRDLYGEAAWCAFLDPSRSLYAPGVQATNVDLKRLLVVRPREEALHRVALRLVESQVFPLVVIDTAGFLGSSLQGSLSPWVRILRRLSSSISGSGQSVLLLTQKSAPRPLPLPVSQRFEISRCSETEISITVPKSIHGIYSGPKRVPLAQPLVQEAS